MFKLKRIPQEDGTGVNVLWTKEKFGKIRSKDSVTHHAHASGDGAAPARCCRLCGGDRDLRCLGDPYVWEGIEERYDQLLYDCFGVRVQASHCMICEWCVRQLRSTEKFRALVHAAFDRSPSEGSSKTLYEAKTQDSDIQMQVESTIDRENKLIHLANTKEQAEQKRRRIKKIINPKPVFRRANVACGVCGQKYPMIVPEEGCKKFVCSRCKQNNDRRTMGYRKCNVVMPSNLLREHLDLRTKRDLRGMSRLRCLPKKPPGFTAVDCQKQVSSSKYRCSLCPKKFTLFDHLATHMRTAHGEIRKHVCSVCHKDLLTPKLLNEHLKQHCGKPSIYQCKKCFKVFSSKRTLQTHLADHLKIC